MYSDGNPKDLCCKCGKPFKHDLAIGARRVRVAKCRVCPGNLVYMVCERCCDIDSLVKSPCPLCGAEHMWEIAGMVEDKDSLFLRIMWFITDRFKK
jgi:hypothetical protein